MYALHTMMKSSTLNESRKYAPLLNTKPMARIFSTISVVYNTVNTKSIYSKKVDWFLEVGSSMARVTEFTVITRIDIASNAVCLVIASANMFT